MEDELKEREVDQEKRFLLECFIMMLDVLQDLKIVEHIIL